MEQVKPLQILRLIARLVVAGTFVAAGLPKIQDPGAFAASIEGYRIVSPELGRWTALLLPWLEVFIGFGLLIPFLKRSSGILTSCLLILFIGLHISAWTRGLDINCGCFGASEEATSYKWRIPINLLLLCAMMGLLINDFRTTPIRAINREHST